MVPWAQVKEHAFDNLIALCPNDHARAERGEIDRRSLLAYKANLGLVTGRYGDMERRILSLCAQHGLRQVQVERAMDFEFMYLLQDGLLQKLPRQGGVVAIAGVIQGPETYALTSMGMDLVRRWSEGRPIEGD
jgi:hypothetical protein